VNGKQGNTEFGKSNNSLIFLPQLDWAIEFLLAGHVKVGFSLLTSNL
jgi:hypothetical protein